MLSCGKARDLWAQDRFGKAPEEFRRTSDENEGLCFNWAPAAIPLPDSPASGGAVAIAGPYMPLQGSLLPDADLDSFPEQHSLATMVGIFPKPPALLSVSMACVALRCCRS